MTMESNEVIISDLSIAAPSDAVSTRPVRDHWLALPYEGDEVSGTMLWCPVRNSPPEVAVPLPALGLCDIYVGVYGSGTVPIWFNLIGPHGGTKAYNRLHLRLSDDDWFDTMVPEDYPEQPRFTYISEALWRTAELTGQSLVLAPSRQEAYQDTTAMVAYVRLVPTTVRDDWPRETKRLSPYFDSNFCGHYVASRADVKARLCPLRESDCDMVFWTASREDSCYYPTKIGNVMPVDTMPGVYPYWAGRDMQRMLDGGEDPLATVCQVAHECGLEVMASYRRMTCRMPPFVFPLHPDAIFVKRRDLWCADEQGEPVPHLSLACPEVRQRMVALQVEQAENYDIDGVHMFFSRGVPLVYFEPAFLEAFEAEHGIDPRGLALTDERVWQVRARFFLAYVRELRAALDKVGRARSRRFKIAMHVMNSLRICAYYGMDIATMIEEKLLDLILPARGHYFPEELGERHVTVEFLAEFTALARGTGVGTRPALEGRYWQDGLSTAQRAAAYYAAGADGLVGGKSNGVRSNFALARRLGHIDELDTLEAKAKGTARMVLIDKIAGMPFDMTNGTPTCG